jgi:hypothetical protein
MLSTFGGKPEVRVAETSGKPEVRVAEPKSITGRGENTDCCTKKE